MYSICHLNDIQYLKTSGLRDAATYNALKCWPCRGPPPPHGPCILRPAHQCWPIFLTIEFESIEKCFCGAILATNDTASRLKCTWPYFHLVSNKVLIETIITAGDIFRYLSAWKTLWNIQYLLSELYFEQIVIYIENHIFIQYSNIIHSLTSEYKSHCQLSKFTIRDMSFKTKVNSLVNKWELADGAWLNNQRNDGRNTGGHKWPETFWSVYTGTALYNNYIDGTPVSNY